MNFKITRIATVRLITNDLKKSRDFYSALFSDAPVEDSETFVSF